MQITNEQAMQRLADIKARAELHSDSGVRVYYNGFLLGLAEAYKQACVITFEQYMQVTEPVRLAA